MFELVFGIIFVLMGFVGLSSALGKKQPLLDVETATDKSKVESLNDNILVYNELIDVYNDLYGKDVSIFLRLPALIFGIHLLATYFNLMNELLESIEIGFLFVIGAFISMRFLKIKNPKESLAQQRAYKEVRLSIILSFVFALILIGKNFQS